MFDAALRPFKERAFTPLVRAAKGIPASTLSLIGFVFGVAAVVLVARGHPYLACGSWIVNRLFDGLDGAVARARGTQSDRGGYLDIVLDTLVYALLPLGIGLGAGTQAALYAAGAVLAALYVNGTTWMFLAAILEKRQAGAQARGEMTTVTMPRGLVEGLEAVVIYSVLLLLPAFAAPMLWAFATLVTLTAAHRFTWAMKMLG